ncbi:MAG: helix-turn-helix domain-containing protein [Rickettsiales bacterium]|jgi:transcriptional regulator with XRE-family HTH domain|nr:helix-turn-helix domain-containing protein [Rickettsiales bacterium]MDR1260891.1 helix-turn-helix domain-containing protein [Rickettsiales bacterium]
MISTAANNNAADYVNYRMWQKIESCMLMRKYSLEDLASEIGVSLQQMQRYKQGLDEIGIIKLCAIANILSVSVTFLLFELGVTYPGTYKIWQEVERYSLKQGYTQEDLANELGMSEQQMQMYAQGLASVTMEELYAIAKMLSADIIDLMHQTKEDCYEGWDNKK